MPKQVIFLKLIYDSEIGLTINVCKLNEKLSSQQEKGFFDSLKKLFQDCS